MTRRRDLLAIRLALCSFVTARAETLTVGPGRMYPRPEEANAGARDGDVIEVYPASGDGVYRQVALRIVRSRVRWVGMGQRGRPVVLDGSDFDYSGRGRTPRAVIQIEPGTRDVSIVNFEIRGAVNASHNAAGIRINQADGVTIDRCHLHHNQMGIMSNGGPDGLATAQLIRNCIIHDNGDPADPGYNHNLYLGGDSVVMAGCTVFSSTTGHNVKSRARFNLFAFNHVYHSANREFDVVDSEASARQGADAIWIGNLIEKSDATCGNTNVIHFGQDRGGVRQGTACLINNTIITPHAGAVIRLSSPSTTARLVNNVIFNRRQTQAPLLDDAAPGTRITGDCNWLSAAYATTAAMLNATTTWLGRDRGDDPGFIHAEGRDFMLTPSACVRWSASAGSRCFDDSGSRRVGPGAILIWDISPCIGAPRLPAADIGIEGLRK